MEEEQDSNIYGKLTLAIIVISITVMAYFTIKVLNK